MTTAGNIVDSQARRISVAGILLFLAILATEHIVDPGLDPARHEISEYVHGPIGWLMICGFAVWAVSLACTALIARRSGSATTLWLALAAASAGMVITASFATQTSAGRLPEGVSLSTSGMLHDVGSGIATIALLIAALASLHRRQAGALRLTTAILLVIVLPVDVVLLAIGPGVAGFRQRLLVLVGCLWQLCFLAFASRACGRDASPCGACAYLQRTR